MPASAVVAAKAHRRCKASAFILTTIAALTMSAAIAAVPAAAQTVASPEGDTPSVGVTPTESKPDDPNSGQWFVFNAEPGQTVFTTARIGNPARVPQTVKLYLADLVFGKDGTPTIPKGDPTDVGAWGAFDEKEVTLAPQQFVRMRFTLRIPDNADPGDHVGAVVAESSPEASAQAGGLKIIKRVATRLYVTLPGAATQSFKITNVTKKLGSKWWPSTLEVTTLLTNTGRVRLRPDVRINGVKAKGTDVLLARSVEKYTANVHVPWYGGPMTAHVKVSTEAGTKTVAVSLFVIPWGAIAMLPLLVLAGFALRALNRLRLRRVRRLLADVRRLESMVTERQTGEAAAMAALAERQQTLPAPAAPQPVDTEQDQIGRLREAFKRAQRTGSQEGLENVALALHNAGVDARADLRVALEHAQGVQREYIEAALFSYDEPAVAPVAVVEPEPEPAPEPEPEPELEFEDEVEPEPEAAPDDPFRAAFLEHLQHAFEDEGVGGPD
ncbi:MAG: hypothetical protein QOK28_893 [Actinomycetota bacterium]|jgi:hypothetical protein